jgi:hypothetical protein
MACCQIWAGRCRRRQGCERRPTATSQRTPRSCRAAHNPTLARRCTCCSRGPHLAWSAGTRQPHLPCEQPCRAGPSSRTQETRPSSQPAPTPTRAEEFSRVPGAISGILRRRATPPQRPPRPVSRMGAQVRRRSCRSGHRAAFVLVLAFALAFSRYAAGDRRSAAAAGVAPERPAPWPVGRCCWIGGHRRPPADGTAMSDQHRPDTTDARDDEGAEAMVEPTR